MKYICIFLVLYFIPRPPKHKATTQKLAKDRGKGRSNKNDIRYNQARSQDLEKGEAILKV